MSTALPVGIVSAEERRRLLDERVLLNVVRAGARVESRSDYQAVLVQGHPTSHVLHLLLTLVTFGLWLIVWALVAATTGENRLLLTVDEYGRVTPQRLRR